MYKKIKKTEIKNNKVIKVNNKYFLPIIEKDKKLPSKKSGKKNYHH